MITAKASQKTFTYAEVVKLMGICVDHLQNFATLGIRVFAMDDVPILSPCVATVENCAKDQVLRSS